MDGSEPLRTASEPALPEVRYDVQFGRDSTLWHVREVEWTEAISEPYRLRIAALTSDPSEPLALLGCDCTLTLDRATVVRNLHGIVERVEIVDEDDDRTVVRFEVVPAFALLDRDRNSRIWQDVTIPALIQSILVPSLSAYGRELDATRIVGPHAPREYVVQHRESEFAFVCRLLAEARIHYWFDHERDSGREVLVLEDSYDYVANVPTMDDRPAIPRIRERRDLAEVESIQALSRSRALVATRTVHRGFDWQMPRERVETGAPDEGNGGDARGRIREIYDHEASRQPHPGRKAAHVLEQRRLEAERCRGASNVLGFAPGRRFSVDDSADEFVLTHVHHRGVDMGVDRLAAHEPGAGYTNEFECIGFDETVPWCPPPHPRQLITGPQTAIVTGPASEEIHVDEHGRIKVWFPWDRDHEPGDDSSVWIRVAQDWAGAGFGSLFIPRIGMEVVVEFIDGNPDQPLVTRCVHNGDNGPPLELPASKTQSTIRTRSSPGGDGYNELRFEDAAGNEEVYVHAQRDLREEIEREHITCVGANQCNTVQGNRTKSVEGREQNTVGSERVSTIGADDYLKVFGKSTHHHRATLEAWIVGLHQTIVQSTDKPALQTTRVEGSHSLHVDEASATTAVVRYAVRQGETHDPDVSLGFEAGRSDHVARKALISHAGELLESTSNDRLALAAMNSLTASQGAASLELKDEIATIHAREIRLVSGETMLVISPSGISIQTPRFDLEALATVTITGSTVHVD